ncbi:hypothetical protein CYLTODRAFT_428824 [Cylindrobasidium torrendii FP15055 ss-10]|uniref:Peroxisomal membrane protein PEX14 n=1 Tax=Cylindrobasidium torrendii FP15055 ss-10 TaxID=1314674 RepID=A0A0D7BQX6_9AGAR|nr:hypothetical protein CYLTODRAFT_428824 [Cylindrobasidium torrendii FP15055 ss-10]
MASDRQDLIRNATAFLSDPQSQGSTFSQKVQFLESKGLTPPEIDMAFRQASPSPPAGPSYGASYPPPGFQYPQPSRWDWRDYFITAVVSGTLTYGAVTMFKKHLSPHLQPPSSTAYEQDRDALAAQFDAAEAILKDIQAETAQVRSAVEEQKERVDKTTKEIDSVVTEMRSSELKTRDEMREIRDEINSIRDMLPKMIDKTKEAQTQSLGDLQQELKSLKALLLSRGPTTPSNPSSPLPAPSFRPSIPAWQLAGAPEASSTTPVPLSTTPPVGNGKGKESVLRSNTVSIVRRAVETFAPVSVSPSPERAGTPEEHNRRVSADARSTPPLSSSQLADSAITNLRKSISTSRTGHRGHLSLEERLRASFNNSHSPTEHKKDELPPPPADEQPHSPRLIPLPVSPPLDTQPPLPLESISEAEPVVILNEPAPKPIPSSEAAVPTPEPSSDISQPQPKYAVEFVTQDEEPSSNASGENLSTNICQPEPEQANLPDMDSDIDLPSPASDPLGASINVEALQERLKLLEQKFSDVSTSYKRLQAEKLASDTVLQELTPVPNISDQAALRNYLGGLAAQEAASRDEISRLLRKIATHDDRLEELRDMHHLETKSQSEQIESLKAQLAESEALLRASQGTMIQTEEESGKHQEEMDQVRGELEKVKRTAKEEEEKRVKAITLLKTVRQKLVKAEKEREEAVKEATHLKETSSAETAKWKKELDLANADREKTVARLRANFEHEMASTKERYERDSAAQRGQAELEAVTSKSTHQRELAAKTSQIAQLQASLESVSNSKNDFFEQLQSRQAEAESAQSMLESMQNQYSELQYRVRELEDRNAVLQEELSEAQVVQLRPPSEAPSKAGAEIAAIEARYSMRVSDLERRLEVTERERNEIEAEWSRKLKDKVKETDELKFALNSTAKTKAQDQSVVDGLKKEIEKLKTEKEIVERRVLETKGEAAVRGMFGDLEAKIRTLETLIEEGKGRETQLRLNNKTIREELRKVQSSAALLEKQRNPGVGYWSRSSTDGSQSDLRTSIDTPSRTTSPAPVTPAKSDEEVNLEYLRNVILQFLEHKEMRASLVKVLSIILRFTPQETRRVMAKV